MKIYIAWHYPPNNISCVENYFLKMIPLFSMTNVVTFSCLIQASNTIFFILHTASLTWRRFIYTMRLHSKVHTTTTFISLHLPNITMKVKKSWMCKCTWAASCQSLSLSGCLPALLTCLSGSPRQTGNFPQYLSISFFQTYHTLTTLSLPVSRRLDAEVHFVNTSTLTRGGLHSSFWIVDRKHIYIGSAAMDWRSLSKVITNISNNTSVQRDIRRGDKWMFAMSAIHFWLQNGYSSFWSLRNKSWTCTNWIKWSRQHAEHLYLFMQLLLQLLIGIRDDLGLLSEEGEKDE